MLGMLGMLGVVDDYSDLVMAHAVGGREREVRQQQRGRNHTKEDRQIAASLNSSLGRCDNPTSQSQPRIAGMERCGSLWVGRKDNWQRENRIVARTGRINEMTD